MEAKWDTSPAGKPADWSLLAWPNSKAQKNDWEITIPQGLGYVLEFKPNLTEPVKGLKEWTYEDQPHLVGLVYYCFRIMSGIGLFLVGLMSFTVVQWLRGKLAPGQITAQKWLLRAWMWTAPLGYIAVETGWIVRCVGRQPWVVYGEIRTAAGVSNLPPTNVLVSLICFTVVYSILLGTTVVFGSRIIREGPNLDLPVPVWGDTVPVALTATKFVPDSRPVE